MRHVALTGGTGYVGSIIADGLPKGTVLTRLVRCPSCEGDLHWRLGCPNPGLGEALRRGGVTDLVHVAWDMKEPRLAEVERTCVDGSLALLDAAKAAGIERFIFISTISAFDGARSVYGQTKRKVERAVLAAGGVVLRLGLVHGHGDGGMLGTIRRTVQTRRIVPMIGSGRGPQYLLEAGRLQAAMIRVLRGDLDELGVPVVLAEATPIAFRDLVRLIGQESGRDPIRVPVPWRMLHLGLKLLEALRVETPIRSDSVISFVYADRNPDLVTAGRIGI